MELMDTGGKTSLPASPQMLPPRPHIFVDREELVQYVREFAVSQGYVVTINSSEKDKRVLLGCDRGGLGRSTSKRKRSSRHTNCPFVCVGKKNDDGLWEVIVRNGTHNHEPLKDPAEHPAARRFTETEEMLIVQMLDAGFTARQTLNILKEKNPGFVSTTKHIYNLMVRVRQGKSIVKKFNPLRQSSFRNLNMPTTSESSRYPNLIGGEFVESQSSACIDVINPATQIVVSQVSLTTHEELSAAVFAAKRAFPMWRNTPIADRQRIMFKFQALIRREIDKLALKITTEHGKSLKDAYNEVSSGLEAVEHACGTANLQVEEFASNVSNGIDSYSIREPIGVCAGICPFNFPAMVPLWMFPVAVMCGNTFVLKPSEKVPGASIILGELALEAGLPKGVLNIVHGTEDVINYLCDDEDIQAISFVGWDSATKYVHERASASCKRLQLNMRARNYAIVMPDATVDATLDALIAAGFGAAGQKFMVMNAVIFVGDLNLWKDKLVERANLLKLNAGIESGADLGPLITQQAKEQTCRLIQSFVDSGAKLAVDGRGIMIQNYESGNFVGPTIVSDIKVDMECYREEIFGPVLLCFETETLEEAIGIVNSSSNYSNGASIFTESVSTARKFQTEIEAGLRGINVPIAAPLPVLSFTGTKTSFSGDVNFHGKAGVGFYTRVTTVTEQWNKIRSSFPLTPPNRELMVNEEFPTNGEESLRNMEPFTNREYLALSSSDESEEIEDA